jgi:ABC-2 type transport system ATP-binding protein
MLCLRRELGVRVHETLLRASSYRNGWGPRTTRHGCRPELPTREAGPPTREKQEHRRCRPEPHLTLEFLGVGRNGDDVAGSVHEVPAGVVGPDTPGSVRARIGWVPSGDRSLYLRLSGYENLLFFARLYGLPRKAAAERAKTLMELVGLHDAMMQPAGLYSHGMQKRTAIARAFLLEPRVLLFDEATHDLDPAGAAGVRELVRQKADRGASVLWATQRIDELRGFADSVTLLGIDGVLFHGSVEDFVRRADGQLYLLTLGEIADGANPVSIVLPFGTPAPGGRDGGLLLRMSRDAVLGDAIAALSGSGVEVCGCREARPEMEDAFLKLTGESPK